MFGIDYSQVVIFSIDCFFSFSSINYSLDYIDSFISRFVIIVVLIVNYLHKNYTFVYSLITISKRYILLNIVGRQNFFQSVNRIQIVDYSSFSTFHLHFSCSFLHLFVLISCSYLLSKFDFLLLTVLTVKLLLASRMKFQSIEIQFQCKVNSSIDFQFLTRRFCNCNFLTTIHLLL